MHTVDKDYVLGTHDEEVARLGLQHRVWRPRALDAWRRAGFRTGQTLLDIGCGPGWAALDLAEIVGRSGRIIAIDRSRRFLDTLDASRVLHRLTQITTAEVDLDEGSLTDVAADGAWCRWVFAFVKDPRTLLARVAQTLKPRGAIVIHEYFDYSTWRVSPASAVLERFVETVERSWRDQGGEPNIALDLVRWLPEAGFELRATQTLVDVITPASYVAEWPLAFAAVGASRLVDLGYLSKADRDAIHDALEAWRTSHDGLMVTPGVLEIIAVRTS